MKRKTIVKRAFLKTLPVMAGYTVLGIGFGMILRGKGYGVLWAGVMSILIYGGSMQYVGAELLAENVSLLTAALTAVAVNARYLFYGISMVDKYKGRKYKPFLIFSLTDETYSLLCQAGETEPDQYYFWISFLDYSYWITGSILGAFLGEILPIDTKGIDFVLTALFLTIFTEQWLMVKNHLSALVGIGASVLCLLTLGSQKFLIPAMLLIAVLLIGLRKKEGITNE